jgi:two-component system, NarL family, nitrate/nitrite response regulator NarL
MEILIVDDEPLIQEILAAVVRKAFGEVTVVEARDLESAFQRLAHHGAPDLALLDLGLPGQRGLQSLQRFRWKFPHVPVVVVSVTEDPKSIRLALGAGARGYMPKTITADMMVEALKQVAEGGTYVPPQLDDGASL